MNETARNATRNGDSTMTERTQSSTINGINVPVFAEVVKGYARGTLGYVVSAEPCTVGGYKWVRDCGNGRHECGPWVDLPAARLMVDVCTAAPQCYYVALNDDGIFSEFLASGGGDNQMKAAA